MMLTPVDAVMTWALLVEDETKELPTAAAELVALDRRADTAGDDLIGNRGDGPLNVTDNVEVLAIVVGPDSAEAD